MPCLPTHWHNLHASVVHRRCSVCMVPTASQILYLEDLSIAGSTAVAVEEVGGAPHSADVAVIAVELPLGQVILEEIALQAAVLTECSPTMAARGLDGLASVAQGADNFAHIGPAQAMPFASVLHRDKTQSQLAPTDPTYRSRW